MGDEPEIPEDDVERVRMVYSAARSFVRLCMTIGLNPRETLIALGTAQAIVLRETGAPFDAQVQDGLRQVIQVELDKPMAELDSKH